MSESVLCSRCGWRGVGSEGCGTHECNGADTKAARWFYLERDGDVVLDDDGCAIVASYPPPDPPEGAIWCEVLPDGSVR